MKTSRVALACSMLAICLFMLGAYGPVAGTVTSDDPDPVGKGVTNGTAPALSSLDTAEDILQRYFGLIGGRSKIEKIDTVTIEASYFYPKTRAAFDAVFYWKRPDRTRVELEQNPRQVIAYDGKKAWTAAIEPTANALIRSAELPDLNPMTENFRRNPGFESLIGAPPFNYQTMGISAVLGGIVTIDGVKARTLHLTWPDGLEKDYSFETERGLLIYVEEKDQRGLTHTSRYSEYKDIGGLFLSCLRINKGPLVNDEQIIVHQKIIALRINDPISESLFIRPEK